MRTPRIAPALLLGVGALVAFALLHSGEIRERAAAGLGRGMPAREAALARGFVLGEDEEIDRRTTEDFRRSGLSHLLAVSGENVTLLGLLAAAVLGAFGVPLRERLLWTLGLIAVYLPLAGGGPSIQRAAVMGAVGLLATLGGRRGSRLYALALALGVTLAVDPEIAGDVGWQLSFAAVLGILILASPLRATIAAHLGDRGWRRALAEGLAVTISATLATAPLIAYHFETLSTTTLVANVLALPAVAPAMWLGMLSAGLAQIPGFPLEPLNALASLLLAYIAQVASWCAAPGWAELHVHLASLGLLASYLGLAAVVAAGAWLVRRRRLAAARRPRRAPAPGSRAGSGNRVGRFVLPGLLALAAVLLLGPGGRGADPAAGPPPPLRVVVLDVGQGDAILLEPRGAPAVLIDGGPPGEGLAGKLEQEGVDGLGAAVITHDQSDHAAGVEELLGRFPVDRLLYARLRPAVLAAAHAAGVATVQLAAGRELRSGGLEVEVVWPPPELLSRPLGAADPNEQALVLLVRWREFSMLLTADAEAEAVPLDPGPVDVLKVAHHGSEDAGLGALLDRIRPHLAVISVGAGNSYGHPAASTVRILAAHGVRTLRTDIDGAVSIGVGRSGISVQRAK